MLKLFNRKKKDNKGFTLVELVVVIAILAILVGLLAPQYTKYVEKSRKSADATNLDEMTKVVKIFAADPQNELEKGTYVITIDPDNGSKLYKGTTEIAVSADTTEALGKEMYKAVPGFAETQTKSKKWAENGEKAPISAVIEVDDEGGTSVTYSPKKLADYVGGKEGTIPTA